MSARTPIRLSIGCERCVEHDLRPTSNGFGLTLAGGIVTGMSVPWGVLSAVVLTRFEDREFNILTAGSDFMELGFGIISAIVSGTCLLVGIPMLSVGLSRRSSYQRWMEEHRPMVNYEHEDDRYTASRSLRF